MFRNVISNKKLKGMLGLIVIYFIGKAFYDLAGEYEKHKWGHAIAGVATYYLGTLLLGVFIGLIAVGDNPEILDNFLVLSIFSLIAGLGTCWLLYKYLERKWTSVPMFKDDEILDTEWMNRDEK